MQLSNYRRDEKYLQVTVQPKLKTAIDISKGFVLKVILKILILFEAVDCFLLVQNG